MKKINKGLGYLATAAISITIIVVTKEVVWAVVVAALGFMWLSND